MRTNSPSKQDIYRLMAWATAEQAARLNDALACYTFRNLAYRLASVLDYVPDNVEVIETHMGKPVLTVVGQNGYTTESNT